MGNRKVEIVLICEDNQHEAFIRRFLKRKGYSNKPRVEKSPSGRGSAEKWVRERYVIELQAYRSRRKELNHRLIVIRDGDGYSVDARIEQMNEACKAHSCEERQKGERVMILIPCRNIETWIAYLRGQTVDESKNYPALSRERECKDAVISLIEMCDKGKLSPQAPTSLEAACVEYNSRFV
jgi:hypothetical protein